MDSKREYTITLYTENSIGILGRVAGIFTRRKINIESLSTSPSEIENVHRFTIVIEESEEVVRKLCMQIEKQIDVLKAYFNNNDELIWQEQALYKVPTNIIAEKAYVERLLRQYGANTVVIRNDYTVFETAGHREEIDNLTQELTKYGLIEFVRGARIAIIKASAGFHEKLLQFEKDEPSKEVIENEFLNEGTSVFTM
ncbi:MULTISPECIES: acetolactate synthase small subunit [Empedobacter]|uniref:Acetolactate synthase small subunit n=1 Tax=Empedobacter falsenii TaxID=343874 RepID=A0A427BT55_9FLAO|nr:MULTISPECIES: acetolactate synthase small subunit [Empedobacter]MDH0673106.1 acetolactate synthase small subunit [Empedobacter sp. GD03861]MDH1602203.1 acetolactate synthase small subunit [Empedobacter sp. GD03739]RRT94214.1 acetolactate synthase small subunit [Empedobacter falsenii]RRT94407.1 acetolactate synthase small subunit [Empedobacter falsenii]